MINKSSFGGYLTAWHEAGSGGQKIVLLHCSLAHGGAWKGVMKLLSPDFKLYAPDLPGQGQSQDWDQKILFGIIPNAINLGSQINIWDPELELSKYCFFPNLPLP